MILVAKCGCFLAHAKIYMKNLPVSFRYLYLGVNAPNLRIEWRKIGAQSAAQICWNYPRPAERNQYFPHCLKFSVVFEQNDVFSGFLSAAFGNSILYPSIIDQYFLRDLRNQQKKQLMISAEIFKRGDSKLCQLKQVKTHLSYISQYDITSIRRVI